MATHTTNYNLYKPDATDNFSDFREEFNDNMDIIDTNLGGGSGDSVSWNQIQATGTKIAEIEINGTTTDVYAPTGGGGSVTDVEVNGTSVVTGGVAEVTVPTATSDLTNDSDFVSDASYVHTDNNFTTPLKDKLDGIESGAEVNVQADWNEADSTADDFIKNKPSIPSATSDLVNDSGFLTSSDVSAVAMSGDYDDLLNKPSIPSKTSDLTNDSGFITSSALPTKLSDLTNDEGFTATSWNQIVQTGTKIAEIDIDGTTTDIYAPQSGGDSVSWSQLVQSGTKIAEIDINGTTTDVYAPTGGTVTDVTVNGTSVVTSGVAAVIVPTKTSDLVNDSNFVSDASYVHTDNNFTTAEQAKLSGIESGAEVNVQSDWSQSDNTADDYIKNKPTIPTKTSDLNNDSGFLDSSDITVTQIQTTGTKIGTIDVDGTSTDLYAPSGGGGGGLPPRLYVYSDTGSTVTASLNGSTVTGVEISTGLFQCDLTDYGTWLVSGVLDGTPMQTNVKVDIVKEYTINFINGETATPTDDVDILLQCAGIFDSGITTLADLLADSTALLAVISSNNAMNYMARSTTWITTITTDQSAMNYIGLNNYASNKLLSVSGWREGICTSGYFESVLNAKVPVMTSNNTPTGQCSFVNVTGSGVGAGSPYNAFDGNYSTSIQMSGNQGATGRFIYKFDSPLKVYRMDARVINTYSVQYSQPEGQYLKRIIKSTDGTNWNVLMNCYTAPTNTPNYSKNFDNDADAQWFAIELVNARYNQGWTGVYECQFYGRKDV